MEATDYKARLKAAMLRGMARRDDPLDGKEPGLADYGPCVDAFCAAVHVDPEVMASKTRITWARQLRRIAEEQGIAPDVLRAVIQHKEQSEIDWKTWNSPYQAERDLSLLVMQHLSGGVHHRRDRTPEWAREVL
jgi:hypothetical protein